MINKYVFIPIKNRLFSPLMLMIMLLGQTIIPAQAAFVEIGEFNIGSEGFGLENRFDQISVTVNFGGDISGVPPFDDSVGGVVFNDLILSADDVGQTFTVSSGAGFDEAVAFLTNGINDSIFKGIISGSSAVGVSSTEASNFFGNPTPVGTVANGVDFAGYDINHISLTVNELVLFPHKGDPSGLTTEYMFDATVKVNAIPVPAAMWLFSSGLLGLIGIAKKKKQS